MLHLIAYDTSFDDACHLTSRHDLIVCVIHRLSWSDAAQEKDGRKVLLAGVTVRRCRSAGYKKQINVSIQRLSVSACE